MRVDRRLAVIRLVARTDLPETKDKQKKHLYNMKKRTLLLPLIFIAGMWLFSACQTGEKQAVVLGPDEVEIQNQRLSPEALWALGRLGEVAPSPSGEYVVYSVRYFSVKENKGNTDFYLMRTDGSDVRRLTETAESEGNPVWGADDQTLYFLQNGRICVMNPLEPKPKVQVVSVENDYIEGFSLSPDRSQIAYIKQVQVKPQAADLYPDLPMTSGMVFTDMNYRHWDEWVFTAPHIFVAPLQQGKMTPGDDILAGEPYEAPVKPFGGCEQFCWSPDGKFIVYTSRKLTGLQYALSTNTDLYRYDLATGQTLNLTQGMKGYDMNPSFSPSGRYLVWQSMERDGYEADKIRLALMDMKNGNRFYLTPSFDQNAEGIQWADDSKLYFISNYHALSQIYEMDLSGLATQTPESLSAAGRTTDGLVKNQMPVKMLTAGRHDYTGVYPVSEELLLGVRMSMSAPSEIFAIDLLNPDASANQTQISRINTEMLSRIKMGRVEERWIPTTDGKQMLTWVIFPPDFDASKTYPTLLYCQGGPQSTVSQFWSYRWNFQIMAANDYIIVAPNRRGLPGFGQEWLEQISGDYGGQNMKDYLAAIDAVSKEPYVDKDKLGCVGASYGGFSVYWLAGHHNKRFKAFIAHDGMFNLPQQSLETEELWFTNWDLGGTYWSNNPVAQRSFANSPHLFIDKWDTPILIIHGEKEYRILASQGMAAFNAAIIRGIPAELLIYPDENHWVLRPQNGILWQRRFFRFLDRYVKGLPEKEMQALHHAESAFTIDGGALKAAPVASAKEQNTETQVAQ